MTVKEINSLAEFEKELNNTEGLVVVDFHATWCPPCKAIAPKIETLAQNNTSVLFLKVDVDQADEIAGKYEIEAMPTFLFFKDGKVVHKVVGADEGKIKGKIAELK